MLEVGHAEGADPEQSMEGQHNATDTREIIAPSTVDIVDPQQSCQETASVSTQTLPLVLDPMLQTPAEPQRCEDWAEALEETNTDTLALYENMPELEQIIEGYVASTDVETLPLSLTINPLKAENYASVGSTDTEKLTSGMEMSNFVSGIRTREVVTLKRRFSQSQNLATIVLQGLIADIDIDTLPEVEDFCKLANSALDHAATTGIEAYDLQLWESELRRIEFAIYSVQMAQAEEAVEEDEIAKATFESIAQNAASIRADLEEKLVILRTHENESIEAETKITQLTTEIEELRQKKRRRIQEKGVVEQNLDTIKRERVLVESQITELKERAEPVAQQLEVASQHLQAIQYQREQRVVQSGAAIDVIKEILAKYV